MLARQDSRNAFGVPEVTATCVPTLTPAPTSDATLTPTPPYGEIVTPSFTASVTPLPISQGIDLAPGVPDEDKARVTVFRCDGTYAVFVGAAHLSDVPLQPGDVILDWSPPASLVGHQAPRATDMTNILSPTVDVPPGAFTNVPYP